MLYLDVDLARGRIQVSGPEVTTILGSPESVYLQTILGFERIDPDAISLRTTRSTASVLVPLLRLLQRRGLSVELSAVARTVLQRHLEYLKAFEKARLIGLRPDELRKSFKPDKDLLRKLKPYQESGAAHITTIPFAANFSVPGSGKTTMVLAAYSVLRSRGEVEKLLVVGPTAAFEPWQDEYALCFGKQPKVGRITGLPDARDQIFENSSRFEMFLCTYQMFANELEKFRRLLGSHRFMMVVDESHHIKKGPGGIWYDAIVNAAPLAVRRVVLSGTPAPNSVSDIRPQLEFLWPDMPQIAALFDSIGDLSTEMSQVRDAIKPLYTRVKKADLDLPPKIARRVSVEMGPVQAKIYSSLAAEVLRRLSLTEAETAIVRNLQRALMIRLIQAGTNPSLLAEPAPEFRLPPLSHLDVSLDSLILEYSKYEVPAKFDAGLKVVNQLTSRGRKVLVWTTFVSNAHSFARMLQKAEIPAFVVTGLLPRDEAAADEDELTRAEILREFKESRDAGALVATVQSVGESVSLQMACTDALYLDRTFNCGLYMQSMDRIHRIGLPKSSRVHYYLLTCRGTIDEVVDQRLEVKMTAMHRLLNDDIGILSYEVPEEDPLSETSLEDVLAVRDSLVENRSGR